MYKSASRKIPNLGKFLISSYSSESAGIPDQVPYQECSWSGCIQYIQYQIYQLLLKMTQAKRKYTQGCPSKHPRTSEVVSRNVRSQANWEIISTKSMGLLTEIWYMHYYTYPVWNSLCTLAEDLHLVGLFKEKIILVY